MTERSLYYQLDRAVEAMLGGAGAELPPVPARLAPLLRIAGDLRDLPRPSFKTRLQAELERKAAMTTTDVQAHTERRFQTVTPYLTALDAAGLVDFVKQAYGAEELLRATVSAERMHFEVRIGDSILMIGGGGTWGGPAMPAALHLYVPDADAVYRRALQAGAASLKEPGDMEYGDREGDVRDPFGNKWYIATHLGDSHIPEDMRVVTPVLHPRGAPQLIQYLQQAFGAEQVERHESPPGTVVHAKIRIGDSMVELGEAHGPVQPMPTWFYLRVPDVDAVYRRATEAGGTPLSEPQDQFYGDRTGTVQDPFGNNWYIATPVKGKPA